MQIWSNNAASTLALAVAPGATSLTLATGGGAKFPSPANGDFFLATLANAGFPENKWEVIQVTARAGDVFTIVKAQEGTADQAWNPGDKVELRVTANTLATMACNFNGVGCQAAELAMSADTNDVVTYPYRRAKPALFLASGSQPMRPWDLQSGFGGCQQADILPNIGTAAPLTNGCIIGTPSGTLSTYNPGTSDVVNHQWGQTFTGAASANAANGFAEQNGPLGLRGNAALLGGFFFYCRFVLVTIDAAGAGHDRMFFGLSNNNGTGVITGNPSAYVGPALGLAFDDTDATVQLLFRTASGTNKIDTGKDRTVTNQMWDLWLYSEPNGSVIFAHADQWIANARVNVINNQQITSQIPANTNQLFMNFFTGAGSGPGGAPVHRFCRAYKECYP